MYKTLIFLKKTEDEQVLTHFEEFTMEFIRKAIGKNIESGFVESNILAPEKYFKFVELEADSKYDMDKIMNTREGKDLQKDLMQFHEFLTVINIEYNNSEKK